MMAPEQKEVPINEKNLAPGEFYFGAGRTRIHTLLGSCVAITLWHPQRLIGGMCHYLLPTRGNNQRLTPGYFADEAVELFLRQITKTQSRVSEYEVKVFGGGNMFASSGMHNFAVSKKNIASAVSLLQRHQFQVKATDVGGCTHRKIYLELWNGDVWVKCGKGVQDGV